MQFLILLLTFSVVGCFELDRVEKVQISSSFYRYANEKSALATPVVDAVARVKPKRVQISMCSTTPPQKAIQFQQELVARQQVEIALLRSPEYCDSE